jgi:hypothetical protein
VTQMRNLTCCSYVSLIVNTRNITGRHPPGNARISTSEVAAAPAGSLLGLIWGLPAAVTALDRSYWRVNMCTAVSHISGRL